MNRYTIVTVGIFIIMILFCQEAMAQLGPPPNPGNGSNIPLDPMSWILLGAGAAYAGNKYRKGKSDK